jgi:hypothetical protein
VQGVLGRDVVRDPGVRPSRDDHPHPRRRHDRQQPGDAARLRAGGGAAVLVQHVHHQQQPPTGIPAGLGGLGEQGQETPFLPGRIQHRGQVVLSGQLGQLFRHPTRPPEPAPTTAAAAATPVIITPPHG